MVRAVESTRDTPRKRLYRQSPGERWWFALLLVPALLTALAVYVEGPSVERDLQRRSSASLLAGGLTGVTVEMNGRNATVLVPTGQDQEAAGAAVRGVEGIGEVDVERVAQNEAEAKACEDLQGKVDQAVGGPGIPFAGGGADVSPAAAGAARAVAGLLQRCPAALVEVDGHTDASVLNGPTVSLRRAGAIRDLLVRAGVQPARIQANGYGDSFPASEADTPAARALNNRVTLTVRED